MMFRCQYCGHDKDEDEVSRKYGKDLLSENYCSPQCKTRDMMETFNNITIKRTHKKIQLKEKFIKKISDVFETMLDDFIHELEEIDNE